MILSILDLTRLPSGSGFGFAKDSSEGRNACRLDVYKLALRGSRENLRSWQRRRQNRGTSFRSLRQAIKAKKSMAIKKYGESGSEFVASFANFVDLFRLDRFRI